MSVIHEAVKRARGGEESSSAPSAPLKAGKPSRKNALVWTLLVFVIAEAALCFREHDLRLHSEEKMRKAYLELNDTRGNYLEKSDTARRSASELRELRSKISEVESDNFEKEKKISMLTKQEHETEMEKFRLEDEVKVLKKLSESSFLSSK